MPSPWPALCSPFCSYPRPPWPSQAQHLLGDKQSDTTVPFISAGTESLGLLVLYHPAPACFLVVSLSCPFLPSAFKSLASASSGGYPTHSWSQLSLISRHYRLSNRDTQLSCLHSALVQDA